MEKFDDIYQTHYPIIHRLVSGLIPDNELVADLIQEVFVKFYLQLKSGTDIEFPKTWLYRVATNDCLNVLSRSKKSTSLDETHETVADNDENIEKGIDEADTKHQLHLALDRMKPNDKALLLLYSEGLSYKEMAEITGIPFNSIGKSLSRALDKLKLILKNKQHEMSY